MQRQMHLSFSVQAFLIILVIVILIFWFVTEWHSAVSQVGNLLGCSLQMHPDVKSCSAIGTLTFDEMSISFHKRSGPLLAKKPREIKVLGQNSHKPSFACALAIENRLHLLF